MHEFRRFLFFLFGNVARVKSDAFVVVINENVLYAYRENRRVRLAKVLDLFRGRERKISAKKRPRRARRNVLKKRQKKTNASEKKAERGEKNVPVTRTDEDGGFLLFFSSGWEEKMRALRAQSNQFLTLYRIKKH